MIASTPEIPSTSVHHVTAAIYVTRHSTSFLCSPCCAPHHDEDTSGMPSLQGKAGKGEVFTYRYAVPSAAHINNPTQCDLMRPCCTQCVKQRKMCPGYTPQERTTVDKIQRPSRGHRRLLALTSASVQQFAIAATPGLSVDELSTCHFMANYVLVARNSHARGFLEFVPSLVREPGRQPHFMHAFRACALASLCSRSGPGSDLGRQALESYTTALATTSAALQNPDVAQSDSTLASILLLALFENINGERVGIVSWGSHTDAAIQLVRSRGPSQLQTQRGVDLFIAVRTQMVCDMID